MEFTPYLVWNVIITLVVAPLLYNISQNTAELKRQDILLNKTREEILINLNNKIGRIYEKVQTKI